MLAIPSFNLCRLWLSTVDLFSTRFIASHKVSSLDHKLLNHTVDGQSLVREKLASFAFTFLASLESAEVLHSLRYNVVVEFEGDSASFAHPADTDAAVEIETAAFKWCDVLAVRPPLLPCDL